MVPFDAPLQPARFLRRYKRFLADVELEDGRVITVHCPNSGSMKSCMGEGWPARLSHSSNPSRKYPHTLEMLHNGTCWIGINTHRTNGVVAQAIAMGQIPALAGYETLRREVTYGRGSRIDLLLEGTGGRCYVEVKSVTLLEGREYQFPDAVTVRGQKHLRELASMVREGHRAVLFYLIQRSDGELFRPACAIDPAYGAAVQEVARQGVEFLAYGAKVTPEGIGVERVVPMELPCGE